MDSYLPQRYLCVKEYNEPEWIPYEVSSYFANENRRLNISYGLQQLTLVNARRRLYLPVCGVRVCFLPGMGVYISTSVIRFLPMCSRVELDTDILCHIYCKSKIVNSPAAVPLIFYSPQPKFYSPPGVNMDYFKKPCYI